MGTYELSGRENGKPTWSSLTAVIYKGSNNHWKIREKKNQGKDYQDGDIHSKNAKWPTQSNARWYFYIPKPKAATYEWKLIEEDIRVKCTGIIISTVVCILVRTASFPRF